MAVLKSELKVGDRVTHTYNKYPGTVASLEGYSEEMVIVDFEGTTSAGKLQKGFNSCCCYLTKIAPLSKAREAEAALKAANPPIVVDDLPKFFMLPNGNLVSQKRVEESIRIADLLKAVNAPEVVYDETNDGWKLIPATADPLVWMGNGTWLLRSTIQSMIKDTGYLSLDRDGLGLTVEKLRAAKQALLDAEARKAWDPCPRGNFFYPNEAAQIADAAFRKIGGSPVENVLAARERNYGEFTDNAYYAQNIKEDMREAPNWDVMADDVKEALDLIVSKIARMLSGNAEYADSWLDIQGYAKLIEDRINKETK